MYLILKPIKEWIFDKFQSFVSSICVFISCDLMQIGCKFFIYSVLGGILAK